MKKAIGAALMFLSLTGVAFAHRLDEYLQATLVSIERDHVDLSMRLVPGVAVSEALIAKIDTNGDGVLSSAEGTAYAVAILKDLSLTIDDRVLTPRLVSVHLPTIEQMRGGLGEIQIEYRAELPIGGTARKLFVETHNAMPKTVYLINALTPADPSITITAQNRNRVQSVYELDYTQGDGTMGVSAGGWWRKAEGDMKALGLPGLFQLGVRHIAEGTDHLLFLLVLLLAAPLVATGSRWASTATVKNSLLGTLRIVTAFTIGHSITLALAAFGVVHLPSRPIEVLIAVSILISAIHALRPLFPGKESAIAAFFGLIHGLAFASTLNELGLGRWERLAGVLAFNLGIETMQMIVVFAVLPSLILLSRTVAYTRLRVYAGLFAILASLGWIVEREADVGNTVDLVVNRLAGEAGWLAGLLFLGSLFCWLWSRQPNRKARAQCSDARFSRGF